MVRWILSVVSMVLFSVPSTSYALSDQDYLNFKNTSPEFKQADKELNSTWNMLNANLKQIDDKQAIQEIKRYHFDWIDSRRDEIADQYQSKLNLSPVEAYTKVTMEWTEALNYYIINMNSIKFPAISLTGYLDEMRNEAGVYYALITDSGFAYHLAAPWDVSDEEWKRLGELLVQDKMVRVNCNLTGLFWIDPESMDVQEE